LKYLSAEDLLSWPPSWEDPISPESKNSLADIPTWFFVQGIESGCKSDAIEKIAWLELKTPKTWKTAKRTDECGRYWQAVYRKTNLFRDGPAY